MARFFGWRISPIGDVRVFGSFKTIYQSERNAAFKQQGAMHDVLIAAECVLTVDNLRTYCAAEKERLARPQINC